MEPQSLPIAGLSVEDSTIPGPKSDLPVRIYKPQAPAGQHLSALVYLHGGGFVFGGLNSSLSCLCGKKLIPRKAILSHLQSQHQLCAYSGLDSHDSICIAIAIRTPCIVVSVDYR